MKTKLLTLLSLGTITIGSLTATGLTSCGSKEPEIKYVADSLLFGRWEGRISNNTVRTSFIVNNLRQKDGSLFDLTYLKFGLYMEHYVQSPWDVFRAGIITAGEWKTDNHTYNTKNPFINKGTGSVITYNVTWPEGSELNPSEGKGLVCELKNQKTIWDVSDTDPVETTFKLCIFEENQSASKTWDDQYVFVKDKNGNDLSFTQSVLFLCNL